MPDILIIIVVAIVVLIVGLFVFRSMTGGDGATKAETTANLTHEHHDSVFDGFAEATEELAGDFVGVEAGPDEPVAEPAAGAIPAPDDADELTRIKGLGARAAKRLNDTGIFHFAQIAAWTEGDVAALARRFDQAKLVERIDRDRWIEQAGLLANGDTAAFEEKFGRLG